LTHNPTSDIVWSVCRRVGRYMGTIIKDDDFTGIAMGVKPDAKKRVLLPKGIVKENTTYHIYTNVLGQIVLDPQVTIPASEAWLFTDKDALAKVDRGMVEAANGHLKNHGSFAKYVKNAP
jgi:hypothetical protein